MDSDELQYAKRLVGTTLKDKYRLDAVLGIGGMGVVYRGAHRNGKRVAIKTLHPHLSMRADIRARFLKEGYTANAVDHDGVVSVLDDDVTEDGMAFLVMELLTGETLDAQWERAGRRLPPSDVLDAAYQLLDVLSSAHEKGIVHRDLKPENLFVTKSGVLKVLDFGIARVQHDVNTHLKTKTGTLLGTPAYMPPEQALGRVKEIDGRTDLWSVGATMFTLLSGAFVHAADNIEMLRIMAATQPARKLNEAAPQVPSVIAEVVDRSLVFEQRARWTTAREMQDAVVAAHRAAFDRAPRSMKSAPSPRTMAAMAATESSSPALPISSLETDRTERALTDQPRDAGVESTQLDDGAGRGSERTKEMLDRPRRPASEIGVADTLLKAASTTAGVSHAADKGDAAKDRRDARASGTASNRKSLMVPGLVAVLAVAGTIVTIKLIPSLAEKAPATADSASVASAASLSATATATASTAAASPAAAPAREPMLAASVSVAPSSSASVAAATVRTGAASVRTRRDTPAPPSATAVANPSVQPQPAASPSAAATAPPVKKDCDPPYWVDANGKHYKPECM